jgi:hypothetical protein
MTPPKFKTLLKALALTLLLVALAGFFQANASFAHHRRTFGPNGMNAGFLQRHVQEKILLNRLGASGVEGSHGLWMLDLETLNQNHEQITSQEVKHVLRPWERANVRKKQALGCNATNEALMLRPYDKRHQLVLCWSQTASTQEKLAVIVPPSATGWMLVPYGLKVGQPMSKVEQTFSALEPPKAPNTYWRQPLGEYEELRVYMTPPSANLAEAVVSHWAVVHF